MSEPKLPADPALDGRTDGVSSSSNTSATQASPTPISSEEQANAAPKSPPAGMTLLKRVWAKIGIDGFVVMVMVKPALAATISMAIYQKHSVAKNYLNFGYLTIIISVLSGPILPRGKFLMKSFFSVLMTCFAVAMIVLGQWAAIKAREHTTPAGAPLAVARGYNSSASAVNGIFLLFNVFIANTLRAARPALSIPIIQYTIVILVGFTYGPGEATVYRSHRFVKEVLYAFLTGQAISTGVSLLIIPVSSRKVFFGETLAFLQSCRGLLKKQMAFIESLEHSRLSKPITKDALGSEQSLDADSDSYKEKRTALKTSTAALLVLGSKLAEDVVFAKRETAYGYLNEKDVHGLNKILRGIMIPISGLSTIADISIRMDGWRRQVNMTRAEDQVCKEELDLEHAEWLELVEGARIAFQNMTQLLDESLVHVLTTLRMFPGKGHNGAATEDVEKGQETKPISNFADTLERKIEDFREQRSIELRLWAQERGFNSVFQSAVKHERKAPLHEAIDPGLASRETLASARLHIILYIEYLLYSVSKAVLVAVRFADSKQLDGTMSEERFIFPTVKTVTKWLRSLLDGSESSSDELDPAVEAQFIMVGNSFNFTRDPEHLPPKNFGQRLGNYIRFIPRFFGSAPVKFGARTAVGVFSVAIMAYLKNTHVFFIRQRLVWSLVMISIGMNPTSGSAVFNLLGNLTCTLFGMIGAFINWYIVDQKTGGVIAVFFFFMCFYFYWGAKYPRFLNAIVAGSLTHVLIVGYELQVRVIGIKQATATGQPYYPFYELAPYRLLIVGGGVMVGYIWTIFPAPITEASVLRRDLGGSLHMLAKYLSCVTAIVDQRLLEADEGDNDIKEHGKKLDKARTKLLSQLIGGVNGMKANIGFLSFEPWLGGSFPVQIYKDLLEEVQSITYYLTIIAFASATLSPAPRSSRDAQSPTWLHKFNLYHRQALTSSRELASLFALLSASVKNAQALPPYIHVPDLPNLSNSRPPLSAQSGSIPIGDEGPHGISTTDSNGSGILGLENVNEDGYRAVVVIEVAQRAIVHSVGKIVELVRELVGVVDFGYSVVGQGGDAV